MREYKKKERMDNGYINNNVINKFYFSKRQFKCVGIISLHRGGETNMFKSMTEQQNN